MAKPVESKKELRKFGISVGIAFLLLTALFWWRGFPNALRVTAVLGSLLLIGGIAAPGLLKWPYRGWMKFAAGAAWFNTRLILVLVFYLVITPVGADAAAVRQAADTGGIRQK